MQKQYLVSQRGVLGLDRDDVTVIYWLMTKFPHRALSGFPENHHCISKIFYYRRRKRVIYVNEGTLSFPQLSNFDFHFRPEIFPVRD
jgi:hypothetical protein